MKKIVLISLLIFCIFITCNGEQINNSDNNWIYSSPDEIENISMVIFVPGDIESLFCLDKNLSRHHILDDRRFPEQGVTVENMWVDEVLENNSAITAQTLPRLVIPKIDSVSPNFGLNSSSSQSVSIVGSNFKRGVTTNLTNGVYRQKNINPITYVNSRNITTSFNLTGLDPGRYSIEVSNPDGVFF